MITGKIGIFGGCGLLSFNSVGNNKNLVGTRSAFVSSRTKENLSMIPLIINIHLQRTRS